MQHYQAIVIHPDVAGGRCSGTLYIDATAAVFTADGFQYRIPLTQLSIEAGGAGNRFVFLKHKTQPQASVYTSDRSILKDPVLQSDNVFSRELSGAKHVLGRTLRGTLLALLIVAGIVGGLYLLKDRMVEGLANKVPASWEKAAGDKLFTAMSLQYRFIKNDSLNRAFLKVGAPLFKQVEQQGYPITVYFVQDPSINAFALPGGKVVIQSGLIEHAHNWEEVMGVLAHELAHVTRRHHIRGVINNVGLYTILAATVGDVSALAGTFASFGGDLASLANSRAFESEADETGWNYLVKAKINPNGLISFFETINKEEHTQMDTLLKSKIDLSFLSTHPAVEKRIAYLQEKQKRLKIKYVPLPDTFADFKKKLLHNK